MSMRLVLLGFLCAGLVCVVEAGKALEDSFANFDNNGIARKLWLGTYQHSKSTCSWEEDVETLEYRYDWFPTDTLMRSSYWRYLISQLSITTYYPDMPQWSVTLLRYLFGPRAQKPALKSSSCHVEDSEGGQFRIRRLGPFLGTGGFDWHKMKLEDPYDLGNHIADGAVEYMTSFMVVPVDGSGRILGNPPIHIHHANLGPNHGNSSLARVSQWHGDSQCAASDGGTACYITTLPRGFGFPVSQKLRLDVDFNDVRPPLSPELFFWLETAIHIAKPEQEKPLHEVGTVILGVPFRFHWWKSSDFQRLYFVPSDHASALWATGRMPAAGTFVSGKLETHQHMFDLAWIFSGISPEDLGLNSKAWHLQKPWLPWVPSENGWDDDEAAMRSLKAHIRAHFDSAVNRCSNDYSCTVPPKRVWTLNRTVFEEGEDREMPWPKETWTFEREEQFTMVIFHKAMSSPMAMPGHAGKELPQHLAITGHYIPKVGTRASYDFVLPSTRVEDAWTNSMQWFHVLCQYGGPPGFSVSWLVAIVLSCLVLSASLVTWWIFKASRCIWTMILTAASNLGDKTPLEKIMRRINGKLERIVREGSTDLEAVEMEATNADEESEATHQECSSPNELP